MARRNRLGFTLVELLVVIVIISMLVGLLVPAVSSSRARARRTQCANNQHEISLAILQYDTAINHFPGYISRFGTKPASPAGEARRMLSWLVVILPHVGREDLWNVCRTLKTSDTDYNEKLAQVSVRMAQYVCPSAARTDATALNYVANCGLRDLAVTQVQNGSYGTPDRVTNGLFFDRFRYDAPTATASQIKDGAANTLMISENLQANTWLSTTEQEVGMVFQWLDYGYPATAPGPAPDDPGRQINRRKEDPISAFGSNTFIPARPSSNHAGGVNVVYADGHHQFLSESIQYLTYQHLMTPDSSQAARIDEANPVSTPPPAHTASQRPLLPPAPADEELKTGL